MKAKGRRISHNVERADTFGSKAKHKYSPPRAQKDGTYTANWPTEAQIEADLKRVTNAPRTKTQKINDAANRLNEYGRQSKIPTPSPRGKQPNMPKGKPRKKETAWPGTHTFNDTTLAMLVGMEKPRGGLKSKYEAYVAPRKTSGKQGRVTSSKTKSGEKKK